MPKASNSTKDVSDDKQLATVHPEIAMRRWERNLPCNLKQMAVALGISYSVVRQIAQRPGFPMIKGFVFPQFYEAWLAKSFGLEVQFKSASQAKAEPATEPTLLPQQSMSLKPANRRIREICKQAGMEM